MECCADLRMAYPGLWAQPYTMISGGLIQGESRDASRWSYTPWSTDDDRVLELSFLLARRLGGSNTSWVRFGVGPAWVTHTPGGTSRGGGAVGLAAQLDATVASSGATSVGLGFVLLLNANTRASFFSVGATLQLIR